jgi:peroxiredoxin (alkyl hydroperoxide reductase subunit C)
LKYIVHSACPDFSATAVMPDGKIQRALNMTKYTAGKFGVLWFYPLDFNYISVQEMREIQRNIGKFQALNAAVLAISCDSPLAHQVWRNLPEAAGGIGALHFPLVSDMSRSICGLFDLLVADAIPEAATIIFDREGKVVFQLRHDTSIARNVEPILDALQALNEDKSEDTAPARQLILLEEHAAELRAAGLSIVVQSVDTDLDHPVWNELWQRFPKGEDGKPKLSFPFFAHRNDWLQQPGGVTLVLREGLEGHGTGMLLPDKSMMYEAHFTRQLSRDFDEIIRIAEAVKHHLETGEVVGAGQAA